MKTPTEQLQLLEETIEYYSKNPRAISNNRCLYVTPKGNKCAIGRICDSETLDRLKNIQAGVKQDEVWSLLPDGIRDYGKDFLHAIQHLHDFGFYWAPGGLTPEGKRQVDTIKTRFNLL